MRARTSTRRRAMGDPLLIHRAAENFEGAASSLKAPS